MALPPLTNADRAAIAAAVTQAETHSSGEIVTVLSPCADGYWDVALAWSAFVALLALAVLDMAPAFYLGLVDRVLGRWGEVWTPRDVLSLALTVATLKFAGMVLLQLWQPLRLWLVPPAIKAAHQLAGEREFMSQLGHRKAAQVANDHQNVLVHGVNVEQVVLHLADDAPELRNVPSQDAVLVHAPEFMHDAAWLLKNFEE